ncbi:hypothetical protein HDA32_005791 [Spinactinospora alkalitolerans]|uniref:Peptidoglycan recognition protein family domain-containing protein n=1 Tax=Spinactinospora alkalitolerans TaxID=687207 RepID=A0A852U3C2_9ACTN|nr:N-acetylmuramoyl-L-alanine amidase [Spinactinospora alkalitolerans]NYE50671.1 hypothetical protein [Spinactinospora alkalitolerans]
MTLGAVAGGAMAVGGATAAARPAAASGTAGPDAFPATLAERSPGGAGPVRPESGFDHVAVLSAEGSAETAEIRFVGADGPGSWRPLSFGDHARDGDAAAPAALLAVPAGSVGYEVRASDGGAVETVAINTRDGRPVRSGGAATGILTGPGRGGGATPVRYVSRAGWGADESLRFDEHGNDLWPAEFSPVQALTVHHAAMPVDADRRATVRAVYQLHAVEQAWGDIGYHLLIDPEGTVYEGRVSGDDRLPVFSGVPRPGGARSVTAGHVGGYNSGNIGICLLGDFTSEMPSEAARDGLVRVLRLLCLLTGVDPMERIDYVNPVNGVTAAVHGLSRHRDWLPTECPGNAFAENFAALRERVAAGL